jgi:hypothetical protein
LGARLSRCRVVQRAGAVCDGGLKTAFRQETLAARRLDRLDWGPGDQGCNGKRMRRSRGSRR